MSNLKIDLTLIWQPYTDLTCSWESSRLLFEFCSRNWCYWCLFL